MLQCREIVLDDIIRQMFTPCDNHQTVLPSVSTEQPQSASFSNNQ